MYRNVILDFLSFYRPQLNKYQFKFATISLMGRFNVGNISNLLLRADEVITYHIKEPRIYEKVYSFETFSNTICDMIVFTKQTIILKKDELSFINDPYYLKDIRNIDFYSIALVPIIKKDDVVGTIIFYFDSDAKGFSCKQSDLVRLFDNLQKSIGSVYENNIDQALIQNEDYIKIVYLKNKQKCYIDNFLKNKFHFKSNILDLEDNKINIKLKKEVDSKKYRFVQTDYFNIYYINKFDYKLKKDDLDLRVLSTINEEKLDKFSLIFTNKHDLDTDLLNDFSENLIKKYYVSQDYIVYLIDAEIKSKFFLEIKNKYFDNYLILLTSKTITSKMNLVNIVNYILEVLPSNFNFVDYVSYINKLNKLNLNSDVLTSKNDDKVFLNSITKEVYGILPALTSFDITTNTLLKNYENNIFNFLETINKNKLEGYIIPILPSMLESKRIYTWLEKIQVFSKEVKVLISIPYIQKDNIDGLEKGISKLKKQGIFVIVDSSIYFNNKTLYLLDLCNSIYLHKEEYEMLVKYPSGINSAIFQYMIVNYKELLIDYPIDKVSDAYFNNLLYYLK